MAFRFFRRVKLAPGLSLNLSKSGGSLSFGRRGARVTVGRRGVRRTLGIPGTGMYWYDTGGSASGRSGGSASAPSKVPAKDRLQMGFFRRLFIPREEEDLIDGLRELIQGDESRAFEHLRKAAAHLVDGAFLAGLLALKTERLQEAEHWLSTARSRSSELGGVFRKHRIQPKIDLYITEHAAALIGCDARGVLLALAQVHEKLGREDQAIEDLRELHVSLPEDPVVRLSLAELLVESAGDKTSCKEAVRLGEGIENESPIHAALLFFRGKAFRRLGLDTAARDAFTAALRRRKDRPEDLLWQIRYERALLYIAQGRKKNGRQELEKIYSENPEFEDVAERLGITG